MSFSDDICTCGHTFWDHNNISVGDSTWHQGPCLKCKCKRLITIDQWLPQLLEQLEEYNELYNR
jgi:hypothetical protein